MWCLRDVTYWGGETYLKLNYEKEQGLGGSSKTKSTQKPMSGSSPLKKGGEVASTLRNVYLPSNDILGMKVDMNRKLFNVESINSFLLQTHAICPAPNKEAKKTITFKDSDLFKYDSYVLTVEGKKILMNLLKALILAKPR